MLSKTCGAAVLVALAMGAACARAAPATVQFASVDQRRIAYEVEGQGPLTLVMFSGLGQDIGTFDAVAKALSKDVRVVRIDRAGYGRSDPAPGDRAHDLVLSEYHEAVRQAGVTGRYVLAGHSLGGIYAELYAARYPQEVAGLVLEDTRASDFNQRCSARLPADKCSPTSYAPRAPDYIRKEIEALPSAERALDEIRRDSALPVLMFSQGAAKEGGPVFHEVWLQTQADLAAKYAGARHIIAAGSGHNVHKDARELYLSEMRAFLAGVRRAAQP